MVPGFSRTRARIPSPSRSASGRRWLALDFGARGFQSRCRALIDRTQDGLTPSASATSAVEYPSSVSWTTRCRYSTGRVFIGGALMGCRRGYATRELSARLKPKLL